MLVAASLTWTARRWPWGSVPQPWEDRTDRPGPAAGSTQVGARPGRSCASTPFPSALQWSLPGGEAPEQCPHPRQPPLAGMWWLVCGGCFLLPAPGGYPRAEQHRGPKPGVRPRESRVRPRFVQVQSRLPGGAPTRLLEADSKLACSENIRSGAKVKPFPFLKDGNRNWEGYALVRGSLATQPEEGWA